MGWCRADNKYSPGSRKPGSWKIYFPLTLKLHIVIFSLKLYMYFREIQNSFPGLDFPSPQCRQPSYLRSFPTWGGEWFCIETTSRCLHNIPPQGHIWCDFPRPNIHTSKVKIVRVVTAAKHVWDLKCTLVGNGWLQPKEILYCVPIIKAYEEKLSYMKQVAGTAILKGQEALQRNMPVRRRWEKVNRPGGRVQRPFLMCSLCSSIWSHTCSLYI